MGRVPVGGVEPTGSANGSCAAPTSSGTIVLSGFLSGTMTKGIARTSGSCPGALESVALSP
ncbi:hypothetical protein BDQ12DRAFT_684232 [Crucibulum laeve]|uniref:Uncharacterized protein n=1 Tax=Crucibulum laeve TaxID=68775 RepID=A0A5C3MAR9_9AGAR|nr:hypothetical protein BDQ12DRAFT_684232 [Crucibulum laeve]